MPLEVQFPLVNALICDNIDSDGVIDLVLVGNGMVVRVHLKGIAGWNFLAIPPVRSGFIIRGDVKDMALIRLAGGKKWLLLV